MLPQLCNFILAVLRQILQMCQLKELKSKLGVAYIFGLQGLVHLFYLSHFLCPPKFIFIGLSHISLGCRTYIFKQGLLRGRGKCLTKLAGSSQTVKHGSVCGGKMFTSAGSLPAVQSARHSQICTLEEQRTQRVKSDDN